MILAYKCPRHSFRVTDIDGGCRRSLKAIERHRRRSHFVPKWNETAQIEATGAKFYGRRPLGEGRSAHLKHWYVFLASCPDDPVFVHRKKNNRKYTNMHYLQPTTSLNDAVINHFKHFSLKIIFRKHRSIGLS